MAYRAARAGAGFRCAGQGGVKPIRRTNPDKPELALLQADLEGRRDTGFNRAKAAVDSARYRAIVLRTALWLIDGQWCRSVDALVAARRDRPATDFAQEVLAQRTSKIVKRIKNLETLDSRRRHKLRIAVMKLRYATDFFAPLFAGRKTEKTRKQFNKVLKSLQSSLGKVNDIAVHERLARQFAGGAVRTKKRPQKAYAMGLLTGRQQMRVRACLADAAEGGKDLAKTRPFWD
jgi:CHAD domain-containing protein